MSTTVRTVAVVVVSAIALLAWSASASAGPGLGWGQWTSPTLTYAQCIGRGGPALDAEGLTDNERQGRGWYGTDLEANGFTAVIICYGLARGTHVTITVTSQVGRFPALRELRQRLHDRIFRPGAQPPPSPPSTQADGWAGGAQTHRGKNGQRFTYTCPPRAQATGDAWGTDLYTDDSTICFAAVHAGAVSLDRGGNVTIEIRPAEQSYAGTTRNGLTSKAFGPWVGSFVFVR